MKTSSIFSFLFIFVFLTFCNPAFSKSWENDSASSTEDELVPLDSEPKIDFENEDAFLDVKEALASKQFIRRSVLSQISQPNLVRDQFFINHLMGFNAVFQKTGRFAKYTSGVQGLAFGYVFNQGHAVEGGLELSSLSNIYLGYKYMIQPEGYLIWPFVGAGFGSAVSSLNISSGPRQTWNYTGSNNMGFGTFGLLVPLIDIAIKAEVRLGFYGSDRWVLTQGIGAILFL